VSIQTERELDVAVHNNSISAIGVDMGVAHFAALSDGTFMESSNSTAKHDRELAKYMRRMSRREKGSRGWLDAKRKVGRVYNKRANQRRDRSHKATASIVKSHSLICVEDLSVVAMTKSRKGTIESPGKGALQYQDSLTCPWFPVGYVETGPDPLKMLKKFHPSVPRSIADIWARYGNGEHKDNAFRRLTRVWGASLPNRPLPPESCLIKTAEC